MSPLANLTLFALFQGADPAIVLRRAIDAAGGERALRAVEVTRSTAVVTRPTQTQWHGAPPSWVQLAGTETRDFTKVRTVSEGSRLGAQRTPFRIVATPTVGYSQSSYYVVPFDRDSLAARARELRLWTPLALLVALDSRCRFDNPRTLALSGRSATGLRCTRDDVGTFHLRIDDRSAALLGVEYDEASRVYGTRRVSATFGALREVAGPGGRVTFPHQVSVTADGVMRAATSYDRIEIVGVPHDSLFAIPPQAQPYVTLDRRIPVDVQEVAPGIVMLVSDTIYRSLAVVQGDSIVLVETAETEHRMRAILETLRARFPGKRVSAVVATHHHADHVVALPAVFDAGLAVFVHAEMSDLMTPLKQLADRRRATGGPPARLQLVSGHHTFGAGTSQELRLIAASLDESATYLLAYLPALRFLFAADVGPNDASLRSTAARLGLEVERLATAHGPILPWPP